MQTLMQAGFIIIVNQLTGQSREDFLTDISLHDLEKMKVIYLELPADFIGVQFSRPVCLCKCELNQVVIHDHSLRSLEFPRALIFITPLSIVNH